MKRKLTVSAIALLTGAAAATPSHALVFIPGDLVVSSSTYMGTASTVTVGQSLPDCPTPTTCIKAIANGSYPQVFNNNTVDGSFGVTSPIILNQFALSNNNTTATATGSLNVTAAAAAAGINLVTSFSSKSELAINLTPDGSALTFMGYNTTINQLDVSNANTPGAIDATNPVTTTPTARAVGQIGANGVVTATTTNAYSGNNGRAAILGSNGTYYTAGNAGNGSNPQPASIVNGAGVQQLTPGSTTGSTKVGSFSVTQYGYPADKVGKDDNFRGETISNNTLYVTKGSGSNGIDSVYQVGTAGTLPTGTSNTLTILNGFPTTLAKSIAVAGAGAVGELGVTVPTGKVDAGFLPFGIWFANPSTLYVADEGDGTAANMGKDIEAGLQKWSLVSSKWVYDYTLQNGLNLGQNYTVSGTDAAGDSGSYTTATDGLRNITGEFNADGSVTIFGITSTVSNSGDQGADPNELVAITDTIGDTTAVQAAGETFSTLDTAVYGQVLRGVSEAPVPEPASLAILGSAFAGLGWVRRRRSEQRES